MGDNKKSVFKKIEKAEFHFNHKAWQPISEEAKDLITKLLVYNPKNRLSLDEALKHP